MKMSLRIILAIVLAVVLFGLTQLITGAGGYLEWFYSSKYSIESVDIAQTLHEDGSLSVHEIIRVKMRKPFRGLFRYIPESRYVQLSDVNIWVEEVQNPDIQFVHLTDTSFHAQVWFKQSHEEIQTTGQEYTLHVQYIATGVIEVGADCSQLFRQYWSEGWDAPVKNLRVTYQFPDHLIPDKIYTHPKASLNIDGNTILLEKKSLPPNSFGETRFFYEELLNLTHSAKNQGLKRAEVKKIEAYYSSEWINKKILPPIVFLIFLSFIWILFRFLGKEPKIDYQGIYERELPTNDSPDFVNSVVKNLTKMVDRDGMAAVILDLYRKDYIAFTPKETPSGVFSYEKNIIYFTDKKSNDLPPTEESLYSILKSYSEDNQLDLKKLESTVSNNTNKAQEFKRNLYNYQETVRKHVKSRNFFSKSGYTMSFVLGLVMIVAGFVMRYYITSFPTEEMIVESNLYLALFLLTGSILLFLPKEVFGQWSKEGLTFYHQWNNFERFIDDMSLLNEHPPESVKIWEEYLVYATALGCADTVVHSLKNVIPEQKWHEMTDHTYFYSTYDQRMGYLMNALIRSANFRITASNARTVAEIIMLIARSTQGRGGYRGGGRGSSGGIGGGSSSGGGGAL